MPTATLVHTQQTSSGSPMPNNYAAFCRVIDIDEWSATRDLYQAQSTSDEDPALQRFLDCRKKAWFVQNIATLHVKVASKHCNLRWCPLCANSRQQVITAVTKEWLHGCKHPKLLTLTLRHTSSPLANQIDFLYKCFNKLRKRKFFTSNVTGGIWFFQIKRSKTTGEWHPHIHTTIDGSYLARKDLSKLWAEITRGSDVIDIRSCKNIDNSANHIARYTSRPADLADKSLSDRLELFHALNNRRLVGSWGTARNLSLKPQKPADSDDWQNIGNWSTIKEMQGYSDDADEAWKAFITGQPAKRLLSLRLLENAIDGIDERNQNPIDPQTWLDFYPNPPSRKEN